VLESPAALDFRTDRLDLLVLGVKKAPDDLTIAVEGRGRDEEVWRTLTEPRRVSDLLQVTAGYLVSLPHSARTIEQLRLVLGSKGGRLALERIALYPAGFVESTKAN
jgi:hypothetical protein